MVDYSESMAEGQDKKQGLDYKRELVLKAVQRGDIATLKRLIPTANENLVNLLSSPKL